jgi:hypothetical protein
MGEGRHETHKHHRRCDHCRWPRRVWVNSHADDCAASDADGSADSHRYTYSGAIARRHTHS